MKIFFFFILTGFLFFACNQQQSNTQGSIKSEEKPSFFPVTSFLKGQVYQFSQAAVNPLKTITVGDKTDSVWLKAEEFKGAVAEFLTPLIDSLNLVTLFREEKFNDATLDALTLTYDPTGKLPDSLELRHWDVYLDPLKADVKKIYMVKNKKDGRIQQLTWVAGNWCSIRTLVNTNGNTQVTKEEKITWKF